MLPGRSRASVLVFLIPPLALYLVAVALPIVQSLVLSFFSWDGVLDMQPVGLANYVKMFTADPIFWQAFRNTVVYVAVCLFFQLGVSLFVANLLSYAGKGKEVAKTLYLLPAIISTVAIAFLFQRIYSYEPAGLINQVLEAIGLGGLARPWLSDVQTVLVAVSAPEGWRFTGLYMLILYAAILAVPKELEEAARLDGASTWRIFTQVRFPYIRPVWVTTMIMAATYSLRGFDIPYLLTNGGPGQASELLTTYMFKTAFRSTDFGYASTIAVFIVIECIVAVGLIFLLLRRGQDK
ncbi:MAG TPA: sugar ABC transporter permease [Arachnia sp.]|jgi:raffinose/stachyose/melibiose transport system permease protein|nr:sugar ABC transporter permease [Arachnia sp.]HMR12243.1 sugar ABC transporter permease [Arachnia sp.]HMS35758.1 sugar ABC transporter permease [Arachnia sp.]